jgi:DNA-binding PucR family transcriptional regulator
VLSRDQVQDFAQRVGAAVRRDVEPYGDTSDSELDRDFSGMIARNVEIYFHTLAEDRVPTEGELAELADAGRRRLHQGVPLEAIFHSYRVGTRVLWQCLLEIADPEDLGLLGTLTLQFADLVSSAASEGYLGERERRARSHEEATRLFLTRLLSGDLDDEEAVIREGRHFGYDLDRSYVVAVVSPRIHSRQQNVERDLELSHGRSQLQRYRPDAPAVVMRSGLIVAVPDDSVSDVASTVLKALAGVVAGQHFTIGIGTARGGPGGIVASFAEAQRAQTLASILQPKSLICRYDELQLFDLFRTGETVDAFVHEVLGKLLKRDRDRHTEFAQTLEALFGAALNRKLAARRLGVHPNTLSYRSRRIEELLGGSLLEGEFCFRVQLALKLLPLSKYARPEETADNGL